MATNEHIENLKNIRDRLVELRRTTAEEGAKKNPEEAAKRIAEIQMKIEVLENVITEEGQLMPADVSVRRLRIRASSRS
jgi:hypothetical protein